MNAFKSLFIAFFVVITTMPAFGQKAQGISLDDVWRTYPFFARSVYGLRSMQDGEHYTTQIRNKMVAKFKYETGTIVDSVIDLTTLQHSVTDIYDYEFSPDETKLLFRSDSILKVSITAAWDSIEHDVADVRFYHNGVLTYKNNDGKTVNINLQIKTRGNFRRKRAICTFPPMRLKLDSTSILNTIFDGQRKLKLVTHCKSRDKYQQFLFQEFLIYRTYNILTDKSFKVRLLEINYIDTDKKNDIITRYGFLIEDTDDMASRNGAKKIKNEYVRLDKTTEHESILLSLFQFMIGNTDWSVPKLHNIKLIEYELNTKPVAVPYDFDWSGVIAAPYATPAPHLGITSVQERIYRGYKCEIKTLKKVIEVFETKREEIFRLHRTFNLLDKRKLKRTLKYYDKFYKIICNEDRIEWYFIENSRE